MPKSYPDFPSRHQMLDYLKSYAEFFNLRPHIQFQTEVAEISPIDPKGMQGWKVRLTNGETRHYKGVIVANGHHWDKRIPNYPGVFTGKSIHSKDYKNSKDLEGKSVLVVGAGNSGCDIAVEATIHGYQSTISMRRGYYFLPKTMFGIPTAEFDRPWFPVFAQKIFLSTLLKLTNGSNEKYGLAKPDHKLYDHHPIINSQLLYFIRHGRIQPKPDIDRFENKTVYFKDGTQQEVDTLVWATGFKASFPFLDKKFFEWENGYPKRVAGMMAPGIANLYIFGLAQPRGGAGPLITGASHFLAEAIIAQEQINHPIAEDFIKLKAADARVLVGVSQAKREIRLGRYFIKRFSKKAQAAKKKRYSTPDLRKSSLPRARNFKLPFDQAIPKNWLNQNPLESHVANSLNLIFPAGERYFIRSVRAFIDQVEDPVLKEKVSSFIAQEVQHGREHERFFDNLRSQGFQLEKFLAPYQRIAYDLVEPYLPKKIRLAETAALEHYTAAFAEFVLKSGILKEGGHPVMVDLYHWHAAEEIEHKAVVYDLMTYLKISYPIRVMGMLVGTLALGSAWLSGTLELLSQDPEITPWKVVHLTWKSRRKLVNLSTHLGFAFLEYCRPGFHPSQRNNIALANEVLWELEQKYRKTSTNVSPSQSPSYNLALNPHPESV